MHVSSIKKRLIIKEIAMAFAEHGLNAIPDSRALLNLQLRYLSKRRTYEKAFRNWGNMMRMLEKNHPDLMALAAEVDAPKAESKPAVKPAAKKGK